MNLPRKHRAGISKLSDDSIFNTGLRLAVDTRAPPYVSSHPPALNLTAWPQSPAARPVTAPSREYREVEQRRKDEGYRVVPLLLPGVELSAPGLWFDDEPVGVKVQVTAGGLSEALPALLAALGERLPDDRQRIVEVAPPPSRSWCCA